MASEIILDERVKGVMNYYSCNMLTTISQLEHVSDIFYSETYRAASKKISGYIAGRVMNKKEKEFNESLNFLEKKGFISKTKLEIMEQEKQALGNRAETASTVAMALMPIIFSMAEKKIDQKNYADFFLAWTAYLNQDSKINAMITTNTNSILKSFGVNMSNDQIHKKLDAFRICGFKQPKLSKRYMNSMNKVEIEQLNSIAKLLISPLDMDNAKVKERSMEFLCDFFNMAYAEAEQKIDDICAAQDQVSKLSICTAIDSISFFKSFMRSDGDALDMAQYGIDLDPQMERSKENNIKINKWNEDINHFGVDEGLEKNDWEKDFGNKEEFTEDVIDISHETMADIIKPSREQGIDFMNATMDSEDFFGGDYYA